MSGFAFRLGILVLSVVVLAAAWRWLRPSRAHVLCALPAAVLGAFSDWWIEVLFVQAGIWEHIGGKSWFAVLRVPLEMPLAFVPAGMAGLWLVSLGTRIRSRFPPAAIAAFLYIGWCLLGTAADAINFRFGLGVRSDRPLAEILPLYVFPFWLLMSAAPIFYYWLALKLVSPDSSILDTRVRPEAPLGG